MKATLVYPQTNRSAGIHQQAVMTVQKVAALEKVRQGYAAKANMPAVGRTLGAMVDAFANGPSAGEMRNYLRNYLSNGALTSGYSNYHNKMNGLGSTYFNGSNSDSGVKDYAQRVSAKLPALSAYLPKDLAPYARPGVQAASYYYANRVEKVVGSSLGATLPLSVSDIDRKNIEAEERAFYLDIIVRHPPNVLAVFQGLGAMSDDIRAGLEQRAAAADASAGYNQPVTRSSAGGQYAAGPAAAAQVFTDRQASGRSMAAGQSATFIDDTMLRSSSGMDFKVNGQDVVIFGVWNASQTARELTSKAGPEAQGHVDWWFGGALNNAHAVGLNKDAAVAGWCLIPEGIRNMTLPGGVQPFWATLRKKAADFGWAMDAAWNCPGSSTTYYGSGGYQRGNYPPVADEGPSMGLIVVGVGAAIFLVYMARKKA